MMGRAVTVVIPAKDEAKLIAGTLAAFATQRSQSGAPLDPASYEIFVLCNDCGDDTADVVRRFSAAHPAMRVRALERDLPRGQDHVGWARRVVLDLAVEAHILAGRPRGIVASTDADTTVSPTWIADIQHEMVDVDAVAGFVCVSDVDRDAMLAPLRLLYDRELMYRRLIGFAEARFDPRPYESTPRHASFVGANFAVAAETYRRAGGLPPLARLEDQAFSRSLESIDARVKHSYRVRAVTSSRFAARVEGGFASLLHDLRGLGETSGRYLVRSGSAIVDEARMRAGAREFWNARRGGIRLRSFDLPAGRSWREIDAAAERSRFFGAFWNDVGRHVIFDPRALEPIENAIAVLRSALSGRAPSVPVAAAAIGEYVS